MKFRKYYFIPEIISILIFAPILWMAFDRQPPWDRFAGDVIPAIAHRGEQLTAIYYVGPLNRYCTGTVQREIIDVNKNLHPRLTTQTIGVWKRLPEERKNELATYGIKAEGFINTPGMIVPEQAAFGSAIYRVQTFWYCNWLQQWLDWPIRQIGPDLAFIIEPTCGESKRLELYIPKNCREEEIKK